MAFKHRECDSKKIMSFVIQLLAVHHAACLEGLCRTISVRNAHLRRALKYHDLGFSNTWLEEFHCLHYTKTPNAPTCR